MRTHTEKIGSHPTNAGGEQYLIFCKDPDETTDCSISIWYNPETLECVRLHRYGKCIGGLRSKADREKWNTFVMTTVVRSQLLCGDTPDAIIDVDIPID